MKQKSKIGASPKLFSKTNLPGTKNAILNLKPINPGEPNIPVGIPVRYAVTGHTIQTVEMTAAEVMTRFGHDFDKDGEGYLTLVAKDNAVIELSADVRHGTAGFRANRYELVNPTTEKREWDEWPLFFETLDQAIELFALPVDTAKYEEEKRAAMMRF